MAVSLLYFAASVALVIGLPAILTLFERRGFRTGLTAVGVFTVGCVGIAGFAMLLVFFRALVVTNAIDAETIDAVGSEAGLAAVLYGWIAAFYLGELLLSIALFRARTTRPVDPRRPAAARRCCSRCRRCCPTRSSR